MVREFLHEQWAALLKAATSLETVWGVLYGAGLVVLSFVDRQVGGMTPNMVRLFELQVVGFFLGNLAALLGRGKHYLTFRSDVGIRGAQKKAAMWAWIWLLNIVDLSLGVHMLRNGLVIAYCLYEASSIAETYVNLGWWGHQAVERLLVWRLEELRDSVKDVAAKLPGLLRPGQLIQKKKETRGEEQTDEAG